MFGGSDGHRLPLAALSFHFCLFSWMYLVQVERKLARSALMSPSSRCSSRDVCRHCELWGHSHQRHPHPTRPHIPNAMGSPLKAEPHRSGKGETEAQPRSRARRIDGGVAAGPQPGLLAARRVALGFGAVLVLGQHHLLGHISQHGEGGLHNEVNETCGGERARRCGVGAAPPPGWGQGRGCHHHSPIWDWATSVEVRSQRGEKGSPSSASLSPCRGTKGPHRVVWGSPF